MKIIPAFIMIVASTLALTPAFASSWGSWDEDISSNTKHRQDALRPAEVAEGRVISVRKVKVVPSNGARATGAAIGTVAGVLVAREVDDSTIGRIAGATLGGLVAQGVTPKEEAYEVVVKYFSPSRKREMVMAVTTKEYFPKGQDVYLIYDGSGLRLAPRT
jgi:outer membrane lipoprotein SlyB